MSCQIDLHLVTMPDVFLPYFSDCNSHLFEYLNVAFVFIFECVNIHEAIYTAVLLAASLTFYFSVHQSDRSVL